MSEMIPTKISERWDIILPSHRAARTDWDVWEKERLAAIYNSLVADYDHTNHPVIFDIGAEEGDFPALYAKWGYEVVLFEPNPLVWPNIRAIFEANKLRVLDYFVGFAGDTTNERPAELEAIIDQPAKDGWPECAYGDLIGNHGFRNLSERQHDTPSIRIDDYVAKTGIVPDALTIDVEGSELFVLMGAEKTLLENDVQVFVSIHPEFMFDLYKKYAVELFQFMACCGYEPHYLAFDHEFHYHFKKNA